MDAVRKTRSALRLTQTEFASKLGKSLATVVRYETLRPPKGRTLANLQELAEKANLQHFAEIFRAALAWELGSTDHEIHHIGNLVVGDHSLTPQNEEEARRVKSMLRFLRSGQNTEAEIEKYAKIDELLQPEEEDLK